MKGFLVSSKTLPLRRTPFRISKKILLPSSMPYWVTFFRAPMSGWTLRRPTYPFGLASNRQSHLIDAAHDLVRCGRPMYLEVRSRFPDSDQAVVGLARSRTRVPRCFAAPIVPSQQRSTVVPRRSRTLRRIVAVVRLLLEDRVAHAAQFVPHQNVSSIAVSLPAVRIAIERRAEPPTSTPRAMRCLNPRPLQGPPTHMTYVPALGGFVRFFPAVVRTRGHQTVGR